jgi:prepilin-type N-terminal cleavage/methylation domain-containing protein/prepilin-type processing-associated H-X9-DG protein
MAAMTRESDPVKRERAFTLIELLVVVSIIAVLMSLLAPSMARARKQADQVRCLANQRQLTMAWMQFAHDQEDRLCKPDGFRSSLMPYAPGSKQAYSCEVCGGGPSPSNFEVGKGYGLSSALGGETRDGVVACGKLHRVTFPSERLVFADIEEHANPCFWPVVLEKDRWLLRPWSWPPSSSLQGMTARHLDGCNMSFADGHAAYRRWKDPRTLRLIKGLMADSGEASSDNTDLDTLVAILTRPFPPEGST